MSLTGSLGAPKSCLRCQLRQVIFNTRLRAAPRCNNRCGLQVCRSFSTPNHHRQEREDEEDEVFLKRDVKEDERSARYKREYPLGRIVGQPGRRQRERTETLRIDSMKRPFDVVLMQDIHEPKERINSTEGGASQERIETSTVTAAQVASGLLDRNVTPSQDEVNASIDALRPETNTVNEDQFNSLSRQLSEGYNTQQLSLYLTRSRRQTDRSAGNDIRPLEVSKFNKLGLSITSWRPGRTPIEQRHTASKAKKETKRGLRKMRIMEQILRSVWDLSIHSEAEQIGELEISLRSWQYRYLFELRQHDKPNYEQLIQPQLVLGGSEVLPHKLDAVMRIVARKRDAEEIAHLIVEDLRQVGTIELDMRAFKSQLGKPGWPNGLAKLFPESSLKFIGDHTTSVIEIKNESLLLIYNKSEVAREHAKRLLLSLLQLPSPTSIDVYSKATYEAGRSELGDREPCLLPQAAGSSLHFRDRGLELYRLAVPTTKLLDKTSAGVNASSSRDPHGRNRNELVANLVDKLDMLRTQSNDQMLKPAAHNPSLNSQLKATSRNGNGSYWNHAFDLNSPLSDVQVCNLLSSGSNTQIHHIPRKTSSSKRKLQDTPIVQADIPGINTLLSYFEPIDESGYAFDSLPKPPYLVARLFPSPLAGNGVDFIGHLPRLELWYQQPSPANDEHTARPSKLRLSHVNAILQQQELRVPQPEDAVDLRFLRKISLTADLDRIVQDEEIAQFTETLLQSASDGHGILTGRPSLKLKLPSRFVNGEVLKVPAKTLAPDAEVQYLFGGFEQVQVAAYSPLQSDDSFSQSDPTMKHCLSRMSDSMFLEHRSIEGGLVGGNRGELTLKFNKRTMTTLSQWDDNSRREQHLQLVEAALSLGDALTRINMGEVVSYRVSTESS